MTTRKDANYVILGIARQGISHSPRLSGWPDSNRRPPRPKRGALAKLRYSPYVGECSGWPGMFAVTGWASGGEVVVGQNRPGLADGMACLAAIRVDSARLCRVLRRCAVT